MFNTPEKLAAASKHSYQTQITLLHELGQKVFESGNKLLTLHAQMGKALLEDGKASASQWLHSKHPFDFWSQHSRQFQPTMDHLLQYKIQLAEILSDTQTELLSYSLKKAVSLQNGLSHPGEHPKAAHPIEPKAASPAKPASASTEPVTKAAAKPASKAATESAGKSSAKPAAKSDVKPAAKVASKNAIKAAPSATSKPAAPKAVAKVKPVLTAGPTQVAPTAPQVEAQAEPHPEPQSAAVAPVVETTTTPQAV
jgi:phasin family protein